MDLIFGKPSRRKPQSSSSDDEDDYQENETFIYAEPEQHNEPKQHSRNMQLAIRTVSAAINADNLVCDDFESASTISIRFLFIFFYQHVFLFHLKNNNEHNMSNQKNYTLAYKYYRRLVTCLCYAITFAAVLSH